MTWANFLLQLTTLLNTLVRWRREIEQRTWATKSVENQVLKTKLERVANEAEAVEEARSVIRNSSPTDSLPNDGFRRD